MHMHICCRGQLKPVKLGQCHGLDEDWLTMIVGMSGKSWRLSAPVYVSSGLIDGGGRLFEVSEGLKVQSTHVQSSIKVELATERAVSTCSLWR